jgi:3-hydroxybutyryl-CoA dehydrogenase
MAPGLAEKIRLTGYNLSRSMNVPLEDVVVGITAVSPQDGLRRQVLELDRALPAGIPLLCQCADISITEVATWMERPERLVGFDGMFFAKGAAVTLIAGPTLTPRVRASVEQFINRTGACPVWVSDSPGLVLPRIVCMLANEAIFAVQEQVAEAEKVDLAMKLGVNYPKGPIAWTKELGYANVLAVLDHLYNEFHEDRYRAAWLLRRWERLERVTA